MNATHPFRRGISTTERMYFPMRELAPPFLMQLAIPGEGEIDPERLRRAVAVAAAVTPGARLVRRGAEWVDSGVDPAVRIVPGHRLLEPALETDPVLTSAIGPTPEATVEVLLLTGAPVTLIFRVFHGVMDGMGMVVWAGNVLRALRGQDPLPQLDPIADQELVQRVGAPGRPTPMVPRYRSAVGRGRQRRGLARHLLRTRSVDAAGPGALARVCALLAAETTGPSRIMMPVDLRRHDPELRSTANLALPLFLDIAPGSDWTRVRDQIKTGLRERRELNQLANTRITLVPDRINRGVLHTTNWLGARVGRNLASATVSHMGRFTADELAVPGFRPTGLFVLPQHSVAMPLLFGLTEFDGRTQLTVSARNGAGIEERLEALLDRIVAMLEAELPMRDSADPRR
ncbi:peptide synthetase [Nocardia mangyaensis]|uniref:Peptide synthetase n=1 Tax=Nocardia mangyaensis TaxID=2213200 RepID=A0A1J0VTJ6_9NOCA|nr:peptide synthetase [Nocardia mangyaensis]APE35345.1 peptide synthetase [Nocardia mangyaensis]